MAETAQCNYTIMQKAETGQVSQPAKIRELLRGNEKSASRVRESRDEYNNTLAWRMTRTPFQWTSPDIP